MKISLNKHIEHWQRIFPEAREVRWQGAWLENDYCRDCRYCCGPQEFDSVLRMPLLPQQWRPDLEKDFYLLDDITPFMDGRGCRACTVRGCRLPREQRPVACGLFPLVFTRGSIYLYLVCPVSLFVSFDRAQKLGREAAQWLAGFSQEDRQRLSLDLSEEVLANRYLDLRVRVEDYTEAR